jgi:hypothetical protein
MTLFGQNASFIVHGENIHFLNLPSAGMFCLLRLTPFHVVIAHGDGVRL